MFTSNYHPLKHFKILLGEIKISIFMCSCYTVSLGIIIFVTVGFGRVWVYACGCMRVGLLVWVHVKSNQTKNWREKIKVFPCTVSPPTDLPLNCSLKASVVVAKVRKVPPQAAPHHAHPIWLQSGSKVLQP